MFLQFLILHTMRLQLLVVLCCLVAISGLSADSLRSEVERIQTIPLKEMTTDISNISAALSRLYEIYTKKEKQKGSKDAMKVWRSTYES